MSGLQLRLSCQHVLKQKWCSANLSNPARFAHLKLGDYEGKLAIQGLQIPKSSLMDSQSQNKGRQLKRPSSESSSWSLSSSSSLSCSSSSSSHLQHLFHCPWQKKTQGSQETAIIVSGANVRVAKCCVRHKPVILTWMRIEVVPEGPSAPDHFFYNLEGFRAYMKWSSWRYKETLEKDDLQQ